MSERDEAVIIRGLGLITPLAQGVSANWEALLAGQSIGCQGRIGFPIPSQAPDRVTALAQIAAQEALQQAQWSSRVQREHADQRMAVIIGTSKGPIDTWLEAHTRHLTAPPSTSDNPEGRSRATRSSPSASFSTSPTGHSQASLDVPGLHRIGEMLDRTLKLPAGPRLTVSAACASGLVALIRAVMMLKDGSADRVLVVAAESSLHPVFTASFKRLGVLAPDDEPIRPLDEYRRGFRISEAAAAICLEAGRPRTGDILIDRYALGGDAHHLTGVDPAGRTLNACLSRAIGNHPVDLVHAHATGTTLNDPIELAAIQRSLSPWKDKRPIIYSHKAALGHSLGAAGLISVVLNCHIHVRDRVPGNIHTTTPLACERLRLSAEPLDQRITRSVSVAAGFGGATAAVSLISA